MMGDEGFFLEHPKEVPQPEEDMLDLMELASAKESAGSGGKDDFDPSASVVQIQKYQEFLKSAVKDGKRQPKQEEPYAQVSDEQLGARFLSRIEDDPQVAIERVKNKKWLIYGLMPHNDVGYIYGRSGSYKSFLAVDIASSVASATKWNGFDVDYPGMVLYIAAEGGAELHLRKKAWSIERGADNDAMMILEAAPIINSPTDREQLKAAMRVKQAQTGMKFVLVIIDTFSKCFVGNENDAADMRSFIAGCEDIRDCFDGCSVMFVGHTGKDKSDSMRGSSVAMADCGFSYRITRGKEKYYAEMHTDKIKDAIEPEDMAFEFKSVKTGDVSSKGIELSSLIPGMTAMLEREETNMDFDSGRAEKPKSATSARQDVMSMTKSQIRVRVATNGGKPFPRMVIRDDVINMLMAEGAKENTAKSHWQRASDELIASGEVLPQEGDLWILAKGK